MYTNNKIENQYFIAATRSFPINVNAVEYACQSSQPHPFRNGKNLLVELNSAKISIFTKIPDLVILIFQCFDRVRPWWH